jgi:hypothetical protein
MFNFLCVGLWIYTGLSMTMNFGAVPTIGTDLIILWGV